MMSTKYRFQNLSLMILISLVNCCTTDSDTGKHQVTCFYQCFSQPVIDKTERQSPQRGEGLWHWRDSIHSGSFKKMESFPDQLNVAQQEVA
jgi:hypothetical protein